MCTREHAGHIHISHIYSKYPSQACSTCGTLCIVSSARNIRSHERKKYSFFTLLCNAEFEKSCTLASFRTFTIYQLVSNRTPRHSHKMLHDKSKRTKDTYRLTQLTYKEKGEREKSMLINSPMDVVVGAFVTLRVF